MTYLRDFDFGAEREVNVHVKIDGRNIINTYSVRCTETKYHLIFIVYEKCIQIKDEIGDVYITNNE